MSERNTIDIGEVCRVLGTTSRTLRFYEEKGIITSTPPEFGTRRQYTPDQIEQIKRVLILRSLGLSVSKIKELKNGSDDLRSAIAERQAEITASIITKTKALRILSEALNTLEEGGDLFTRKDSHVGEYEQKRLEVVRICTDAVISGDYEVIFSHFSDQMKAYSPLSALRHVIDDTLSPLGNFIRFDRCERDLELETVYYSYLHYEKLMLRIKFVFRQDRIFGFWLQYMEYRNNNLADVLL